MDIKQIRVERLRQWFANKTLPEKEKSYLSQLLNGKASFGERAARRLERDYGMGEGFLDTPTAAAGKVVEWESSGQLSSAYVTVDRYNLELSAGNGHLQWVVHEQDPLAFRSRFFQARGLKADKCKALYVKGDSMEPFLFDGDTVLIDTSATEIRKDGDVYALFYGDEYRIKRVNRDQ